MSIERNVLAIAIVAAACGGHEPPGEPRGTPITVATAAAHDEALPVLYRTSGTVRGHTTITLTSKVAGYVRAVRVRSGDAIESGQLLVELEANDTRAGVGRARAELARATDARAEAASSVDAATVAAKLARTTLDRDTKLFAGGAISRAAFDDSEARARQTEAQLAAAEARLRGADSSIAIARAGLAETEATLDYARVTAPFAGRVIERRVEPGALASPGLPLLVLDGGAQLRVEATADESHASAIHTGDRVTVEIAGRTSPVTGTVGEIVPSVDVSSRAFVVKVDLPADIGAIQPGTFARVGFTSGTRTRLVVPTTAISQLGALDRVFVVDAGRARLRMITRGEVQGAWTEILSGLSAGELVATDPARMHDGVEVRP